MKTSLIITTYNRPDALALVLESAFEQVVLPDEILVADDGSRSETADLCREMAAQSPVPLIHCWQEDKGFRLARVRNLAISRCIGEYIVMIDGDMILNENFVKDHVTFSKKSCFAQGSRVLISKEKTQDALVNSNWKFGFFSAGISNRMNALRSSFLRWMLSGMKEKIEGVRGANMAFWKNDVELVNGFNEEFVGWGREDSEFVVRLFNSGVKRRNLKFGAVAFHLFHGSDNKDNTSEFLTENEDLLKKAQERKLKRCYFGLESHNKKSNRNH